jgi:hypothetical protein
MFHFVTKYLGFFKAVPGAGLVFDAWLRITTVLFNPTISDYIDTIENEVSKWPGAHISLHKFGGVQFNYQAYELGHIHGNGLLDMLFSREIKQGLMAGDTRIQHHHVFKSNGWISIYIKTAEDAAYAIELLKMAYDIAVVKRDTATLSLRALP